MLFLLEVNGNSPWLISNADELKARLWKEARCLSSIKLLSACGERQRVVYRSVPTIWTMNGIATVADHVFDQIIDQLVEGIDWSCEEANACIGF